VSCPACGHAAPAGSKFCNECGARLAAAVEPQPSERAPRDYTPKHLADKILTSRGALEGERKLVTVLFADVKSSMELAGELDPEEWHRILDRFFEILTDGVHRFEGTVNQYTGDGIMALFGAPIAHEDHAERACHAALHLRGALQAYADEVRRHHGLNFEVRMGLNSGEVVVGKIGDDLRMDYTAQGHTVGLAQRVEELAGAGSANLTEHTAKIVDGFFRLRDLGEFRLRGVKGSQRIYQLEGAGRHRTRLDRARARGLTRFVGRMAELSTLQAGLERALEGRAQVVGVVGEAGVGKSRLCDEFLRQLGGRRDVQLARTQALPHGRHTPLIPWIQILRSNYGVLDTDDPSAARQKVAGRIALLYPELIDEFLGIVLDFMGIPDPDRPRIHLDPDARLARITEFLRRAAHIHARQQIRVFLWDDLHWLDPASDALLARHLEALADTRTFTIVNFRPGYRADWMAQGGYREIALRPLEPEDIEAMVAHVLGSDPSTAALPALLRERTGGNPFFLEETLRSLVEGGHLTGTPGAYQLASPPERLAVPGSVQSVLAARIDRLDERAKRVLQTAAVAGKRFSLPVLERVVDLPGSVLGEAIADLEAASMIHDDSASEIAEYCFEHPLTQEVAYRSQLGERRHRLHAEVARALEAESRERAGENAALIAHHWEEAGERLEAARWHRRAAGWVTGRDWKALDHHTRKTIELLDGLPQSEETRRWGATARSVLIGAAIRTRTASTEEARRLYEEARELLSDLGDETAQVMLLAGFGGLEGTLGDPEAHYRHASEAWRLAQRSGDDSVRMAVMPPVLWGCAGLGRLREGLERADRALQGLPDDDELGSRFNVFSSRLMTRSWRAHFLFWTGRLDEAEAETQELFARLAVREDPEVSFTNHTLAAAIGMARGDRSAVELHAQRAFDQASRLGSALYSSRAQLSMVRDHLAAGRNEEAARAADRIQKLGFRRDRVWDCDEAETTVQAYLANGEVERGRDAARRWLESAHPRWLARPDALLAQAHAELAAGAPDGGDAIRALLEEASQLVSEFDLRMLEPRVHERRAELAAIEGDEGLRRDQLERARSLYRDLGARGHADRIDRELAP
jgi:class 3 adenylate cyclase/tetratricopeptide (TPR) repeat protein